MKRVFILCMIGSLLGGCASLFDRDEHKFRQINNINPTCVMSEATISSETFEFIHDRMVLTSVSGVKTYRCAEGAIRFVSYTE